MGLIETGLIHIYQRTLSPWWFFFYVNFVDSLYGLLTVCFFFPMDAISRQRRKKRTGLAEKWKNSCRKTMKIGGIATVIFLVAVNLFPVSRRFEVVRLNEVKKSRAGLPINSLS
ncbi:MAG: hypothetical protein IJ716_04825 [Lachnospiraceae bacterium]|nr:hypothetical protein [Lachnospiraceae bacterium]